MSVTGNKSSIAIMLLTAVVIANCGTATSYTVQPGDSLSGIAERHNTTFEALVEANAGRYPSLRENPRLIHVGWELVMPGPGVGLPLVEAADVTIQGAPTATPFNTEAIRQAILSATNQERANRGLRALGVEPVLMEVAQERAGQISADFDHRGRGGERLAATEAQERGYQGQVGENIGLVRTSLTGQAAMRMWRNSEAHYQNMVDSRYVSVGVGVVFVPFNGLYVVQVFGTQ